MNAYEGIWTKPTNEPFRYLLERVGLLRRGCIGLASTALWCVTSMLAVGQDFSEYYFSPSPNAIEQIPWTESQELGATERYPVPSKIPLHKLRPIDGAVVQPAESFEAQLDPRYKNYRVGESIFSYMPGDGEQFGWIDFQNTPFLAGSKTSGITLGTSLHLLSGPNTIPLPPRLWDFVLGYQSRATLEELISFDLAYSIGVYSDFEDSAREGVRSLGHAVGSFHKSDLWDWVLGVDYLNRDDYKLLPVMGFSWHEATGSGWRIDLVYPRPRIQYALSSTRRVYLSGLLGGGTWDIEMPKEIHDVMTYRDYQVLLGHERITPGGNIAATEIGLVLNRQVQMRHSLEQVEFDDAFIFRMVARR